MDTGHTTVVSCCSCKAGRTREIERGKQPFQAEVLKGDGPDASYAGLGRDFLPVLVVGSRCGWRRRGGTCQVGGVVVKMA